MGVRGEGWKGRVVKQVAIEVGRERSAKRGWGGPPAAAVSGGRRRRPRRPPLGGGAQPRASSPAALDHCSQRPQNNRHHCPLRPSAPLSIHPSIPPHRFSSIEISMKSHARTEAAVFAISPVKRPMPAPSSSTRLPLMQPSVARTWRFCF